MISFHKQLKCYSFRKADIRKLEMTEHHVRRQKRFLREYLKLVYKITDQVRRTIQTLGGLFCFLIEKK